MRKFHSLFVAAFVAGAASADVITVGPSGADFAQIQPAVDFAAAGDIVVVRASAEPYQGFTVGGKGIAIVGEQSYQPVAGSIRIRDVPFAQTFVLRDLGTDAVAVQPFDVRACAGPVRIERSYASLFLAGLEPDFEASVDIADCADVAAEQFSSFIVDSVSAQFTLLGARIERSRLVAFEGYFFGARGPAGNALGGIPADAGNGTPGLQARDSSLFFHQIQLLGGSGGFGFSGCNPPAIFPTAGGDGAPGLALLSGSASLRNSPLSGGYPGQGGHSVGSCTAGANGVSGAPVFDPFGGVTQASGSVPRLRTEQSIVREGETLTVAVTASAEDVVFLGLARRTGIGFTPWLEGEPLVISPIMRRMIGSSGTGVVTANIPIGELGPGLEGRMLYLQAVVFDTRGQGRWTNLSCVALLDAAQ